MSKSIGLVNRIQLTFHILNAQLDVVRGIESFMFRLAYNNIILANSGCFQSQTDFMNSLGIHPTPGILSIIDLDSLKGTQLDLKISF